MDGDGLCELIVAAPNRHEGAGIRIVSTGTRSVLTTIVAPRIRGIGWEVLGIPDVDGDGSGDVATTRAVRADGEEDRAEVVVFSGRSGEELLVIDPLRPCAYSELRLSNGGTREGGASILVIGSTGDQHSTPAHSTPGLVLLVSLPGGKVIHRVEPGVETRMFGYDVSAGEDLDGDGVGDFLATTYEDVFTLSSGGRCGVYSGASGALIRRHEGGQFFGRSVAFVGDVDEDGVPDYAIGSMWDLAGAFEPGRVDVFSGRSGETLLTVPDRG